MIYSILTYLLLFVWLIIPIRQIGKKHFYFFLAGISGDIATLIVRMIFHSNSNLFVILFLFLGFISLFEWNLIFKNKFLIIILIVVLIFIEANSIHKLDIILIEIINIFIMIAFLTDFILHYTAKRIFSLPLILLVLYELTVVTKYISLITEYKNAYPYFIIASIFEAFVGLFFCIFKEDDPRIIIQLK
ncbi:MAG: hypothetical protein ACYC49_02015 [Ignavibacteriaceae bacterium]